MGNSDLKDISKFMYGAMKQLTDIDKEHEKLHYILLKPFLYDSSQSSAALPSPSALYRLSPAYGDFSLIYAAIGATYLRSEMS